ncbi:MAG: extracellular solute-binding protein [Lachnospiraceae bacterium]|nr:extracellular solute-binding protein [Lachnospiraceae bacterium]
MNKSVRNIIIRIIIMLILSAAVVLIGFAFRPKNAEPTEKEIVEGHDLILWYYDDSMEDFAEQVKADYFKTAGLRVECKKVSAVSFFDNINRFNITGDEAPDLYITETTKLEQAFLGSTAKVNADTDTYSLRNYSRNSLSSVMYDGKMVGYPLCFNTAFFVYNPDMVEKAPKTFKEIEEMSTSFIKDTDSDVDMIMLFDVSNLLDNYLFIGNYLDLGGDNGDDRMSFDVYNENLIEAAFRYQELGSNLKIDLSTTTYDLVENSFAFGRCKMALLNCSSLSLLNELNAPYVVAEFPKLTDALGTKGLSDTWCVCVNPMSEHVEDAENLAKFMTYDEADAVYGNTGYMSCLRSANTGKGFKSVYKQYEISASLPKLIETDSLWKDLKVMLNDIWTGADVASKLDSFQTKVNNSLSSVNGIQK